MVLKRKLWIRSAIKAKNPFMQKDTSRPICAYVKIIRRGREANDLLV